MHSSPAPATEALNALQQSGELSPRNMPQHKESEHALPITVTTTSFDSNRHNHKVGSVHASKQLHPGSVDTPKGRLLTAPAALAPPGGGITLGTHAAPWPPASNTNDSSERGYSAASRASINIMRPQGNLAGKRSNSEPAISQATTSNSEGGTYKYQKVIGGKIPRSVSMTIPTDFSPQFLLDKMIQSRGYSTQNFCSLEGAYYCKPTPLQIASYGIKMVETVRGSDAETLERMLDCGLSPNPCNVFGESVVHMVCRRGDYKLLKILLDKGCSLQVTDDFGRTPLHDACWTAEPNFEIVELILNTDARLLHVVDCRGSAPLSYIKKEHWKQWIDFFRSKVDRYWSPRDVAKEGEEPPPRLANEPPHSRPIPDPPSAATIEVATTIASGGVEAEEVLRQKAVTSIKQEDTPLMQVAAPA